MKKILILGAGRSSSSLIKYLLEKAASENYHIIVTDIDIDLAKKRIQNHPNGSTKLLDINNSEERRKQIEEVDVVVSMLPAFMHKEVAKDCLMYKKHLFTASYVSPEIKLMHHEAYGKGLLFMNEIGLDPGIDHASAMQLIHHLKAQQAEITSFKSFCGGLIAPQYNNNPWGYKFTWNPRNVVLAGQATAQYLENGKVKFTPYSRLFVNTESIEVAGLGKFEAYANRDSMSYLHVYELEGIKTLLRGTLRMPGFCGAWNALVQIGLTDDSFLIKGADKLTYTEFLDSFLSSSLGNNIKEKIKNLLGKAFHEEIIQKLEWLELLSNKKISREEGSPAQILQDLLEEKWRLEKGDKDMIVMQHIFEYTLNNQTRRKTSSLVVFGEDEDHTAMAKTVGLPLAITLHNFLNGKINLKGVHIPVLPEIYIPLLNELKLFDITFKEEDF